jgi:hypothetical protein
MSSTTPHARDIEGGNSGALPTSTHTLFVLPRGESKGFQASVRGFILDLHDPSSYALAPTTDDLFIVSIAAALAWAARGFLRARRLPDYVSVAADWRSQEDPPSPAEINLTVTVSPRAEAESAALSAFFESSLAARFLARPALHISFEGVNR